MALGSRDALPTGAAPGEASVRCAIIDTASRSEVPSFIVFSLPYRSEGHGQFVPLIDRFERGPRGQRIADQMNSQAVLS